MSWVAYLDPAGRPTYDLKPFVPPTARVISEHAEIRDARDAAEAYRERAAAEAMRAAGQKELPL
jgi:hypothetical protein